MFGKLPITALQEFCAKKGFPRPEYTFGQDSDPNSKIFICTVEIMDTFAEGVGRSKKEAKHEAAAQVIKKLKLTHTDIEDIIMAPHEAIPTSDAVADLRDLCLLRDHPLPQFELLQQAGPPEAPEFTMECRLATIVRHATSSSKKSAKQLAAQKILEIVNIVPLQEHEMQVATLDETIENELAENKKKVKTYREYIDSDVREIVGTKLGDRHLFFKKLDEDLRKNAKEVFTQNEISEREKVDRLLRALNIKYKETNILGKNEPLILFELLCDFDVVFAESSSAIYPRILSYFETMF